jgi:hypothetical protein
MYMLGVPEDKMEEVACASGFKITLVDVFNQKIMVFNEKGKVGNMTFCNTRENHIEQGSVVMTTDCLVISSEEMKVLYKKVRSEKQFFHVEGDIQNDKPTRLYTIDGAYKCENKEKDVFAEFNDTIGLKNYRFNATKYPDVNAFIKESRIIHSTPLLINANIEATGLVDMPSAYSQFQRCSYYAGFLGKIHQWRSGSFDAAFLREHIGIYRATIVSCNNSLFEACGIMTGMTVTLPSVELLFFMDNGVVMQIDSGVFGSRFDFTFPEEMLSDRRYTRWSGILGSERHDRTYTFPASSEFASHLSATCGYPVHYWGSKGLASVRVPKKTVFTTHHILAFITSYVRIQMLQAMSMFQPDQIVKVVLDGIYHVGDAPSGVDWFRSKPNDVQNVHTYFASWYAQSEVICNFPPVQYSNNTLVLGQGGCGKTHGILTNGAYNNPLYVVPQHVLGQTCTKKYGCNYTTIHKLLGFAVDENGGCKKSRMFKEEQYYPDVIVIDELTQIDGAWIDMVFNEYPESLVLICGDIEVDGMAYQTRNGKGGEYMKVWKPVGVDVVTIAGDRRSQCDKLSSEKLIVRNVMRKLYSKTQDEEELALLMRQYAKAKYSVISHANAVSMFSPGDNWIAGTHKTDKKLLNDGVVSGWYKKGGFISFVEKEGYLKRGSFTIHAYQGSTISSGKCFISVGDMFEFSMLYTAISRCVRWEQIVFVE